MTDRAEPTALAAEADSKPSLNLLDSISDEMNKNALITPGAKAVENLAVSKIFSRHPDYARLSEAGHGEEVALVLKGWTQQVKPGHPQWAEYSQRAKELNAEKQWRGFGKAFGTLLAADAINFTLDHTLLNGYESSPKSKAVDFVALPLFLATPLPTWAKIAGMVAVHSLARSLEHETPPPAPPKYGFREIYGVK